MARLLPTLLSLAVLWTSGFLIGLGLGLILSTTTIVCPPFIEEHRVVDGGISIAGVTDDDLAWLEKCFALAEEVEKE